MAKMVAMTAVTTGVVHATLMTQYGLQGASGIVFLFIVLSAGAGFRQPSGKQQKRSAAKPGAAASLQATTQLSSFSVPLHDLFSHDHKEQEHAKLGFVGPGETEASARRGDVVQLPLTFVLVLVLYFSTEITGVRA